MKSVSTGRDKSLPYDTKQRSRKYCRGGIHPARPVAIYCYGSIVGRCREG